MRPPLCWRWGHRCRRPRRRRRPSDPPRSGVCAGRGRRRHSMDWWHWRRSGFRTRKRARPARHRPGRSRPIRAHTPARAASAPSGPGGGVDRVVVVVATVVVVLVEVVVVWWDGGGRSGRGGRDGGGCGCVRVLPGSACPARTRRRPAVRRLPRFREAASRWRRPRHDRRGCRRAEFGELATRRERGEGRHCEEGDHHPGGEGQKSCKSHARTFPV